MAVHFNCAVVAVLRTTIEFKCACSTPCRCCSRIYATPGFGIDGDAYANYADPTDPLYQPAFSTAGDWFCDQDLHPGTATSIFDCDGNLLTDPAMTMHYVDGIKPFKNEQTIFTSTNKLNDDPNTYTWGPGSVPPKDEMQQATIHFAWGDPLLPGGDPDDLWCIFAADRWETNGDSYIDFEFLQKSLYMNSNGTFTSEGEDGGRTAGDILVTILFHGGGANAEVAIDVWTDTGGGVFEYERVPNTNFENLIFITQNTVATVAPWDIYDQTERIYSINQYAEGAINLTQIMGLDEIVCGTISTAWVRTKSSGESAKAELKDFPGEPFQVNITTDPPVIECGNRLYPKCTADATIIADYESWKAGDYMNIIEPGTADPDPSTGPWPKLVSEALFDLLPADFCDGFETSYEFIFEDYCGLRDTVICTFVVDAPDPVTLTDCPGDPDLDGCSTDDEIETAWNTWLTALGDMVEAGGCSDGIVLFDPPLDDLEMPLECVASQQMVSVTATAEDHCNTIEKTCTFTVEAYADDLDLSDCPGDPALDGCSTDVEIEVAWTAWLAGLAAMVESGTCSDGEVVFDPPLDDLEMPLACVAEQQVVSVTATAEDHCNTIEKTCTFTVEAYADDLDLSDCPGDPALDGCSTDVEIEVAWTAWLAGLAAMVESGTCSDGEVVFDPPLDDLEMPLECVASQQMVSVTATATAEDHCNTIEKTCTFTVDAYPEPIDAFCEPGPVIEACDFEGIDVLFQEWKDGFGYTGGCLDNVTDNSTELEALNWMDFGDEITGWIVSFTYWAQDHCTRDEATCEFIVPPCAPECETAYGMLEGSETCFIPTFSQWGWTNYLEEEGEYDMGLYAGAAGCNTENGWGQVGTVHLTYGEGSLRLEYSMLPEYSLSEVHIYVGCGMFPVDKKGKLTVAPGQYTVNLTDFGMLTGVDYTIAEVTGPIYVIAHAVVCEIPWTEELVGHGANTLFEINCPSLSSAQISTSAELVGNVGSDLRVYPNPFNEKVTFEFVSAKDAYARIEITNIVGQRVVTLVNQQVKKGVLNRVEFEPKDLATGILIYKLVLDNNVRAGRIVYKRE